MSASDEPLELGEPDKIPAWAFTHDLTLTVPAQMKPVIAAVLATVAQLQAGTKWTEIPSDTPYDTCILGAAEDVVEALRLKAGGAK